MSMVVTLCHSFSLGLYKLNLPSRPAADETDGGQTVDSLMILVTIGCRCRLFHQRGIFA